MKIIDLFYNIMTDEKVPQKIKYHNKIWELGTNKINGYFDYINCDNRRMIVFFTNYLYSNPNDEVEILEEKKIPEKSNIDFNTKLPVSGCSENEAFMMTCISHLGKTIDSLIDYLKSKGDE